MRSYEEVHPGTAAQIIDWAERSVRMAEADVAADADARRVTAIANARVLTWVSPLVALLPYATLAVALVLAVMGEVVGSIVSLVAVAAMTALPKTIAAANGKPIVDTISNEDE